MGRVNNHALEKQLQRTRTQSITRRWLINSLSIVILLLMAVIIGLSLGVRNYYYNAVEQALYSRANATDILLTRYSNSSPEIYDQTVRALVEGFSDRDKMEMMLIDRNGRVTITSSGFLPDNSVSMPDYVTARSSENGYGLFQGVLPNGESVVAVSLMTPNVKGSDYSAVRYITSVTRINNQILTIMLIFTVIFIAIIFFIGSTSAYFIRSIVFPLRAINSTALKIAMGDFDVRLEVRSNDEIGELSATINHMAQELGTAERLKNDFISSVSHELRTPLTAIKGWGETLRDCSPEDTLTHQRGMRVILGETERLSNMVEELLDFSRMQNGKFNLIKVKMDIVAELSDAVLMYGERAKRENITLNYKEPEDIIIVLGDKNRLRQVFVNIIDNALKYSDPGDTVTVRTSRDKDFFNIYVSDTGIGIPAEDLEKVKLKFYKVNQTRRGSGIGLAVADEIISAHGGKLDLTSVEGEGTTVSISLPLEGGSIM